MLFPSLGKSTVGARAAEFRRRCRILKIEEISLHSYRYAWAERAKTVGYPERFAQEALGHKSKAVHRAYAKKAHVILPSLEEYERADQPLLPRFDAGHRERGDHRLDEFMPKRVKMTPSGERPED